MAINNPFPMPRPTTNEESYMGITLDDLKSRIGYEEPSSGSLLSNIRSGLLGAGQAVGRGVGQAAGLLGESVREPLAAGVADIPDVMRFYEAQRMSQPMMAYDPAQLKPVTPSGVVGMLPQLRAAEQAAVQKPELDQMKAMADLARASGSGRVRTRYKYPSLYVNKDNPDDFIRTLTDTQTQQIVDQADFKPIDTMKYVPSSLGVMGKGIASRADLKKEYAELNTTAGQFKNVQKFFDKLPDLERGLKGKMQAWSGNIKTFFDADLSPKEAAKRLAQGEQQGLLGMFREQVVGGGVMTEQDARRVMERLGNSLGDWTTDPSIVARAVQSVMEEKYQTYVGDSQFYGSSRSDFRGAPEHKTVSMPTFELPQSFVDEGLDEDDWAETPYEERLTWRGLN
jgi:hypothetical protein